MIREKVITDLSLMQAGELLPVRPPPLPARRLPLDTIEGVRREACRVYRDMRSGAIEKGDGTKLIYALSEISKLLVIGKMESRLLALELATAQQFPQQPEQFLRDESNETDVEQN